MPKPRQKSVKATVYLYHPKNNKNAGKQTGAVQLYNFYGKRSGNPKPFSTIGGMLDIMMSVYIDRWAKDKR